MKPPSDILDLTHAPGLAAAPETRPTPRALSRFTDFYELTKPRMNFLVVITTMVGYYIASDRGEMNAVRLMHTLLGTALCAASASVLNQLIERRWDALMKRTRNRPIPAGRIAPREALLFGVGLGVIGAAYLAIVVNPLTAILGAFTMLSYIGIYTPMKRWSSLNTVIGAVPGAIPPVMGFTAATGALSLPALALFAILFLWQMPHFLAIAILYKDDYAAGGFKMLPNVDDDLSTTGRMMILYGTALVPMSLLPVLLGIAGAAYFTAAVLLGLAYLSFGISCAASRSRIDARKLFFASIVYLPLLLAAMMIDKT